jgi:hypothetical protein
MTGIVRQIAVTGLRGEQAAAALALFQHMYGAAFDQPKYHHAEVVREAVPRRDFTKAWLIAWTGVQRRNWLALIAPPIGTLPPRSLSPPRRYDMPIALASEQSSWPSRRLRVYSRLTKQSKQGMDAKNMASLLRAVRYAGTRLLRCSGVLRSPGATGRSREIAILGRQGCCAVTVAHSCRRRRRMRRSRRSGPSLGS